MHWWKYIKWNKEKFYLVHGKKIYKNHDNLLEAGEKLLLRENFTINNNKITVSESKGSFIHNIPSLFVAYCKDIRFVKIEVKCNYKKN